MKTRHYKFYTKKELIEGKHNKPRNIVQEVQDEMIITNLLDIGGYAPVMANIADMMEIFNIHNIDVMRERITEANREFVELIMKSEIPFLIETSTEQEADKPIDRNIYIYTDVKE